MNPATIARGVWPDILPIILLVCSNLFMTLACMGTSNTNPLHW